MDSQTRAEVLRRLRCVEGHVRGIIHMVEEDRSCLAIVRQIQAVQGAMRQINILLVAEHFDLFLDTAWTSGKGEMYQQLRDELLALWVEIDY